MCEEGHMTAVSFGCVWVVFIVSYALHLLILGSCYTAHKRIVDIMKVYIKRNNSKVELIRLRKKYRLYSRLRLRGERARTTVCLQPIH